MSGTRLCSDEGVQGSSGPHQCRPACYFYPAVGMQDSDMRSNFAVHPSHEIEVAPLGQLVSTASSIPLAENPTPKDVQCFDDTIQRTPLGKIMLVVCVDVCAQCSSRWCVPFRSTSTHAMDRSRLRLSLVPSNGPITAGVADW